MQRAFTGEPDEKNQATREIGFREIVTVVPLLGLSLFLGFYPKPVLDRLQPSVNALVVQVDTHSIHKEPAVNQTAPSNARPARSATIRAPSQRHVDDAQCHDGPGK